VGARQVCLICCAILAEQNQVAAGQVGAVIELARWGGALLALTDGLGLIGEVDVHALVEDVERTLPQAVIAVAETLSIADNATLNLIDLFEAAVTHDRGENLAADSTGAVGDNRLVLEVIVTTALQVGDEVAGGLGVWNDRVLKLANLGFEGVSSIEEHHIVATFGNQLVYLLRLEVNSAAHNTLGIDDQLFWGTEGNDLGSSLDTESREVIAGAFAPLEVNLAEAGILLGLAHILLEGAHVATQGAIDTVLANQHSTLETEAFAQGLLPELYGLRILDGSEAVVKNDFLEFHLAILPK